MGNRYLLEFNIIGTYSLNPFSGVFDGNNHKISNFSYESSEGSNIGLFGYVSGENAEIKNLGLIEPNIHVEEAGYYVGSLVGCLGDGIISGCYARGGSVSGRECIGGLVGDMRKASASTVAYCYSSAVVSGTYRDVGGLMGRNNQGSVSRCYCTGSVSGGDYVGGLVGRNNEGIVSECYSSSSVSGGYCVGGLVAINHFDGFGTPGVVTNCYATGSVWAGDYAAGLVANNYCSRISNCYSIGYVSGDGVGGGLVATTGGCLSAKCIASFWDKQTSKFPFGYQGIPKTTVDMQTRSTFTGAGWDFGSVWDMCDGMNYPRLAWQVRPVGDIACPDGVEMNDLGALVEQWLRPVLASDVAPEGGDGMVNFVDWVFFANEWQTGQDIAELAVFADQWLQSSAYCADIAPEGGDGIVNMLDICAFADHWLEGE